MMDSKPHKCPTCESTGKLTLKQDHLEASCVQQEITCPSCHGTGLIWFLESKLSPISFTRDYFTKPEKLPEADMPIVNDAEEMRVWQTPNHKIYFSKDILEDKIALKQLIDWIEKQFLDQVTASFESLRKDLNI